MSTATLDVAPAIRGLIAESSDRGTRARVAEAIGVHPETLRRRLNEGQGSFSVGEVDVIATVLGTTAEEIIRRARAAS